LGGDSCVLGAYLSILKQKDLKNTNQPLQYGANTFLFQQKLSTSTKTKKNSLKLLFFTF
jgi:hypothetical protein